MREEEGCGGNGSDERCREEEGGGEGGNVCVREAG